jgi:hypothetical protein
MCVGSCMTLSIFWMFVGSHMTRVYDGCVLVIVEDILFGGSLYIVVYKIN